MCVCVCVCVCVQHKGCTVYHINSKRVSAWAHNEDFLREIQNMTFILKCVS